MSRTLTDDERGPRRAGRDDDHDGPGHQRAGGRVRPGRLQPKGRPLEFGLPDFTDPAVSVTARTGIALSSPGVSARIAGLIVGYIV